MNDAAQPDRLGDQEMQFALEQYKALRAELLERTRLDAQAQRNGMVAIGVVLGLAANVGHAPVWAIASFLSCAIALLVLMQQARHKKYGMRIGQFCRNIEKRVIAAERLSDLEGIGWEHLLELRRREEKEADNLVNAILKEGITEVAKVRSTFFETAFWMFISLFFLILGVSALISSF